MYVLYILISPFIHFVGLAPSFLIFLCPLWRVCVCVGVQVHKLLYLLALLSFHAYGANSHLLLPLAAFLNLSNQMH